MPRVLILNLASRYGGASARALALAAALGPRQAVIGCLKASPTERRAIELGIPRLTLGSCKSDPRIIWRLRRATGANGFKLVDCQNPQAKFWTLLACRNRCAFVSTLNSWVLAEYGPGSWRGRFYGWLERRTYSRAHAFVAVSEEIRAKLVADGAPTGRISVISNAVSLPEIETLEPEELRRRHGFRPDARICCAVGRLAGAKGYPFLLEALCRVDDSVCCLVLGDGECRREIEKQIRDRGLGERVRLLGMQPPDVVLATVAAAEVFVMPSLSEGTPVALLEAAALKRPIVATTAGGIPELVRDGEEALLVAPGDSRELAMALERVLADGDLAARLASGAAARVKAVFSLEAQAAATQTVYARALDLFSLGEL